MQTVKNMVNGILVGAAIYVASLACHWQLLVLTPKSALELLITSAIIGVFSLLLQTERLSFGQSMVTHMVATFVCLILANFVFGWGWLDGSLWLNFVLPFVVIYLVVWLVWWLQAQLTVRQINAKLRQH